MVVVTKYRGERNRTVARLRSARKDRRIRGIMCKKEKGKGVVVHQILVLSITNIPTFSQFGLL